MSDLLWNLHDAATYALKKTFLIISIQIPIADFFCHENHIFLLLTLHPRHPNRNRQIQHQFKFRLVINLFENGNYNQILVRINKIRERFLSVCNYSVLQDLFYRNYSQSEFLGTPLPVDTLFWLVPRLACVQHNFIFSWLK